MKIKVNVTEKEVIQQRIRFYSGGYHCGQLELNSIRSPLKRGKNVSTHLNINQPKNAKAGVFI